MEQGLSHHAEAHEAMCRRCGRCCYAKFLVGDRVIYTDTPCVHLDLDTRLCRIYDRRHEVNPDCLDVEQGILRGVFPADCPYVAGIPGYKAPIEDTDPSVLASALEALEAEEVNS